MQEVRTVLHGIEAGFEVSLEYNKVGDNPIEFVGFSAHSEKASISGGYYSNGSQFNLNVSGYEEGFSVIIERLFNKCVEVVASLDK
ncbi:hypothetical protein ACYSNX_02695 [Myroides sp. LJL115]